MKKKRSPLGSMLRQTRRSLDLTLREVSHKTGISQGYLSDLEAGNPNGNNPTLSTMRELTRVYRLEPASWFEVR